MEIAIAEAKDAGEIIVLQRLAYQSEARLYNDWSLPALTQSVESLRDEFETSVILKAVAKGNIIGSVRAKVEYDVCKIGRLIVHPDFQKQGIGSRLLEEIERLHSNTNTFELFTGSKSASNIRLYEKHGYVVSYTKALSENVAITFLVKSNGLKEG
jgi:ribosomal protein S18 acetylase RimI-like enzyme